MFKSDRCQDKNPIKKAKKVLIISKDAPPIIGGSCLMLEKLINSSPLNNISLITTYIKDTEEYNFKSNINVIRSKLMRFWNETLVKNDNNIIECLFFQFRPIRGFVRVCCMLWICIKIMQEKYDIIFAQQVDKWFFIFILFSRFILKKRVVSQAYGEELNHIINKKNNIKKFYHKLSVISAFSLSNHVIAITLNAKSQLLKLGVKKNKISVVYPGVNTKKFHPNIDVSKLKSKYDYENNDILLFVSRIDEKRKGQDTAIKVLSELDKRGFNNIKLLIIGKGKEIDYLYKLVKKSKLENKVIFLSNVSTDELPSYYCLCDVSLYLGRKDERNGQEDGFGIVCLEANACGKPVIGGNVGGIIEAVINNKTGFIVDPYDIKETSQKIEYLLVNKEYAEKIGYNGLKRARKYFDWDLINHKYWSTILNN